MAGGFFSPNPSDLIRIRKEFEIDASEIRKILNHKDFKNAFGGFNQEYTVKKDDTLSHIAKRFYDRASKWTLIYEANADKIKDPSRIKPGTVLIIPDLVEAESRYIK